MFRAVPCSSSGGQIVHNTICPPEDEQDTARNMLRIIM